jgi:hypothetical protein
VFPLIGGGLWGLGIAFLMKADAKALIKTGALTWGGTLFICYMILGIIGVFRRTDLPVSVHYKYLALFSPPAGIASAFNARVLVGKLGLNNLKKKAGLYAGVAATIGFIAVGLILQFGFGWEVGRPMPGRYSMPTILQWCCPGAALAGGMALGWVLAKSKVDEHQMELVNPPALSMAANHQEKNL